jgi:hypothetical protein
MVAILSNWLVRILSKSNKGDGTTESGYFVSEPDATQAVLTAIDAHEQSVYLHDSVTDDLFIDMDLRADSEAGVFLSSTYGE